MIKEVTHAENKGYVNVNQILPTCCNQFSCKVTVKSDAKRFGRTIVEVYSFRLLFVLTRASHRLNFVFHNHYTLAKNHVVSLFSRNRGIQL